MIDLRSDTVTRPVPEMREAIAQADVGDDIFGEDPSVNALQEKVAAMLGKEAGLFVPTGSMSNQIAIKTHTSPGDEVICETGAHIFNYESGGPAFLSHVQVLPLQGEFGIITAEQIEPVIRPADIHHPKTSLISLENTHNRAGGTIFPLEEIEAIRQIAKQYQLNMHLDGARLWNAHISTGISLDIYAKEFDSVSVCFSKGLGAPVGSMLLGTQTFIDSARRYRKIFGGGMRQAGVLAAAANYAIDHHIARLKEDHDHAFQLAQALQRCSGVQVNMQAVQTNIVYFNPLHQSAQEVANAFREKGVLVLPVGPDRIRLVTHLDVSHTDVEKIIEVIEQIM